MASSDPPPDPAPISDALVSPPVLTAKKKKKKHNTTAFAGMGGAVWQGCVLIFFSLGRQV
jgi:hypothetical protein